MHYLLPLIILLAVFCFAILSKKIETSYLTLPMFFTALGFSIQFFVPDIAQIYENNEYILLLAEVTLILVLFSDAAQVNVSVLKKTSSSLPECCLSVFRSPLPSIHTGTRNSGAIKSSVSLDINSLSLPIKRKAAMFKS